MDQARTSRRRRAGLTCLGVLGLAVMVGGCSTNRQLALLTTPVPAPSSAPVSPPDPIVVDDDPAVNQVAAPTPPPSPGVAARTGTVTLPILMYHYIRVNPVKTDRLGYALSVAPDQFAAQMDYLRDLGAHTITPDELMAALQYHHPLPAHPVMLTFDDGYADFATTAVPILLAHGFVGVSYVVSGFMGHPGYMTPDQVKQVEAAGMVIGCHTLSHPQLAKTPSGIAWLQIHVAKGELEQLLGHPVVDFAYPYGSYSAQTISLVRQAGFRSAVTTNAGTIQSAASPFTMTRSRVRGVDSVTSVGAMALLPVATHPYVPRPPATVPSWPHSVGGRRF